MTDQRDDDDETGSGRLLTTILMITLGVSVLLNGFMIFRSPARMKMSCPTAEKGQVKVLGGELKVLGGGDDANCAQKLRSCRQAEVSEIIKVIQAGAVSSPGSKGLRTEARIGTELQQSVLCDVARRKQRRRWYNKRQRIAESLVPNLEDQKKQQRDLNKDVDQFARVLGWSEAQKARFQQRYGQARQQRLASVLGALKQSPVAYDKVFAQVRGLYADEDRLVRELYGDRARQQLRAARLENRTVIMAIAAAMANMPWDHSMSW